MMMNKSTAKIIWVVDDDRSVRIVLSQALRDAGYRVQNFDNADMAILAMQTDCPTASSPMFACQARMVCRSWIILKKITSSFQ
jgi:DNA-binding NtrC family response regulator